jgi:hypothetical protein
MKEKEQNRKEMYLCVYKMYTKAKGARKTEINAYTKHGVYFHSNLLLLTPVPELLLQLLSLH